MVPKNTHIIILGRNDMKTTEAIVISGYLIPKAKFQGRTLNIGATNAPKSDFAIYIGTSALPLISHLKLLLRCFKNICYFLYSSLCSIKQVIIIIFVSEHTKEKT